MFITLAQVHFENRIIGLLPDSVIYLREDWMGRVSNRQVVEELRNGDRKGAGHLLELYQDRLTAEAVQVFHVPQPEAEEIVSDALLTVVQRIDSFEFTKSDGDFHFWLMAIFRNRVRDFFRQKALTEGLTVSFEELDLENKEEYSGPELDVVRNIVQKYEESLRASEDEPDNHNPTAQKLQAISETLDSMETWERVLLRCRALDVPYEDIAHYTGKPVHQLKVYHARVKQRFMKLLAKRFPQEVKL